MSSRPAAMQTQSLPASSACIHCGLCLAACPTYLETGNENFSPRGRIHIMRGLQSGTVPLRAHEAKAIDSCLGCRACESACPSGVAYGELLEACRSQTMAGFSRGVLEDTFRNVFIEGVIPYPERFELTLPFARWLKNSPLKSLIPSRLQKPLEFLPSSTEPTVPLPEFSRTTAAQRRGRVALLKGCVMGLLFNATHHATIKVLNAAGYDVWVPNTQGCCGALLAHAGNRDGARAQALHNLHAFSAEPVDAIVSNAAGCGAMLKEYHHLFHDLPNDLPLAESLRRKAVDFSELIDPSSISWLPNQFGRVSYQDACHLAHAQKIRSQPRKLLERIAGSDFVEMQESDVCCGSAGSYNLTEPEMSARLQRRKVQAIQLSQARTIVTANPGCLLQMQAGLSQSKNETVRVVHIADFLAAHLPDSTAC